MMLLRALFTFLSPDNSRATQIDRLSPHLLLPIEEREGKGKRRGPVACGYYILGTKLSWHKKSHQDCTKMPLPLA